MFEGKKEYMEKLIDIVHEGPSNTNVTDLKLEWLDYKDEFTDFQIIY